MITAAHLFLFSTDAPATREYLRDVLGWDGVEGGSKPGWLIFPSGPSELAVHPTAPADERLPDYPPPRHQICLICDDAVATREQLAARGAVFNGETMDRGWGLVMELEVPGAGGLLIYEPRHPTAFQS